MDSRKNFYYSLSASDAEKFKKAIRIQAVNDARMLEQTLLDEGLCTREMLCRIGLHYIFSPHGKRSGKSTRHYRKKVSYQR